MDDSSDDTSRVDTRSCKRRRPDGITA